MNGLLIKNDLIDVNKGSSLETEFHFFTEEGKAFDLTDYTVFCWSVKAKAVTGGVLTITQAPNANGSSIVKQTPNELGVLLLTLGKDDVALLDERENQEVFVKIEKASGEAKTFRYDDVLNVYANLCA